MMRDAEVTQIYERTNRPDASGGPLGAQDRSVRETSVSNDSATEASRASGERRLPRRLAFANASIAMTALMASVGAPPPLYAIYQEELGVTQGALMGSYGTYILAAALSMLIGGRLSDFLGRRSVALLALVLAASGCLWLINISGPSTLIMGRGVQGVAVGLGISTLGTYVIDLRAEGTRFLASLIASATPTVGVAVGAILAGGLVEFGPRPSSLVYQIFILVLATCAAGVLFSEETSTPSPGALKSLRPVLAVPVRMRAIFLAAVAAFIASWSLGGLYQSLGPSIAVVKLGSTSQFLSGAVVASLLAFTAVGGPLTSRMRARTASICGLVVLAVGGAAVLVSVLTGTWWSFLVASAVAGVGFGAACTGSMRALLRDVRAAETAGLISAVYLVGYLGSAIPSFVGGQLIPRVGMDAVLIGYAGLIGVLVVIAVGVTAVSGTRRRLEDSGGA